MSFDFLSYADKAINEINFVENGATRALRAAQTMKVKAQEVIAALESTVSAQALAIADRDAQIQALRAEIERLKAPPVDKPADPVTPPPVTVPDSPPASPVSAELQWGEDATRDYYSYELRLPWARYMGDFFDADGTLYGATPFATITWDKAKEVPATYEADVTALVRRYGGNIFATAAAVRLYSREHETGGASLIITKGGATTELRPTKDTAISSSTGNVMGKEATMLASGAVLLGFAQGADPAIERAVLRVHGHRSTSSVQTLKLFAVAPQVVSLESPAPADGTDADVVLRIKGEAWRNAAGWSAFKEETQVINPDGSLTVTVPKGGSSGAATMYLIPEDKRRDVMFSRVVMRLHEDFTPDTGGKLPGLSNTGQAYGSAGKPFAGYGGNTANGTRWSARTNRYPAPTGAKWMGFHGYVYRLNRTTFNGEGVPSTRPLPIGETFVLDQMVKLNTINPDGTANADGEVTYWLDGECVNRMTGIRFRDNAGADTLPSEYWLDVYIGGTGYEAPYPHRVTFYEVTVSTKRLPL